MARTETTGLDQFQKEFMKLVQENARRHRKHEVFRDFCELAALAISNSVDLIQREKREARYMEIIGTYEKDEAYRFKQMLAQLVDSLSLGFHDSLGTIFMSLELGDHWKGQYFTPFSVAYMMAKITTSHLDAIIERNGFFTANEPAAGAGAMVIGLANAIEEKGLNYQQVMHVTAQDIDETAVHMAYIQLSLLHIPAIVLHGNSLWPEKTWGHWVTPAHVIGLWDIKLRRRDREDQAEQIELAPDTKQPEIEQQRVEIVARRIEKVEQLNLFA